MKRIIILVVIIFLALLIVIPSFIRRYNIPSENGILNNLRQIDGAKQEWAIETGITNQNTPISEKDIEPYISSGAHSNWDWLENPTTGEQYKINPLGLPPEACLTKELVRGGTTYPAGTIVRYTTNGDVEYILPPK
jgi:hypothetical protein